MKNFIHKIHLIHKIQLQLASLIARQSEQTMHSTEHTMCAHIRGMCFLVAIQHGKHPYDVGTPKNQQQIFDYLISFARNTHKHALRGRERERGRDRETDTHTHA